MLSIVRTRLGRLLSLRFAETIDISRESTLRAVAEARAMLRRGGVVWLAGDGASGSRDGNVEVNVLGRKQTSSRGFAELSLASGVAPTPIFSRVDEAGNVHTWLEPPLSVSGATHRARAESLARSYARLISTVFARHPGNVSSHAMRGYLKNPPYELDTACPANS